MTPLPAQKSVIALVGNPNCGKTTLFNVLTGARQKVGNWPGVTVERKSGFFSLANDHLIEVVDLPGIYSLTLAPESAIDERIASEFILTFNSDVIVNIVDASNLERHLYLTTQLLEAGAPVVLALNMMDLARSRYQDINIEFLRQQLGCPVITLEAHKGKGIQSLKELLAHYDAALTQSLCLPYPEIIQQSVTTISTFIRAHHPTNNQAVRALALRLLENDAQSQTVLPSAATVVSPAQHTIQQQLGEDADILIAETRYKFLQELAKQTCIPHAIEKKTWTQRIDNIVLNRILGLPIFFAVMYLLFFFAINVGGAFQDFFDISSQTIFVDGFGMLLNKLQAPTWLAAILANGFGKGINTTITFIPVIGAMFLFLSLLEDSGYMARAAFIIDRLMRVLGLPGKAFVPMIVGFGCNVPAVMAARTLENQRDRILTIMMSPFMSCGARLAIFAVFTAAFFHPGGQNVVFALYVIGIVMAVFTGFLLRHTLLQGEPSPLVMELPPYHVPSIKGISLHTWQRLKGFVFRAGKLIVPICILIGALNTLNMDGTLNNGEGDTTSLLSMLGKTLTPLFAPMGLHADNWPATVGLVTGILAKEVVVGTLNTLYTQMGQFNVAADADVVSLWLGLKAALASIPDNFSQLSSALSNPVLAKAPLHSVNQGVYGLMAQKFHGKAGAFAYLLFVLLYFPCISTTAVMLKELHRGWSIFSIFWMTGIAYAVAVAFYQIATITQHPVSSLLWLLGLSLLFSITLFALRYYANKITAPRTGASHEPARA